MDHRETAFDPFSGTFNETRMVGFVHGDETIPVRCHYVVCSTCNGRGSHVNPSIDSHGISAEEFAEDPDFAESYWRGDYDQPCNECHGSRVSPAPDDDDPNKDEYDEAVSGHYELFAEYEAERRVGA